MNPKFMDAMLQLVPLSRVAKDVPSGGAVRLDGWIGEVGMGSDGWIEETGRGGAGRMAAWMGRQTDGRTGRWTDARVCSRISTGSAVALVIVIITNVS